MLASADEYSDAVSDRFANRFDATPSRSSATPVEELSSAEEPTSEQEEAINKNRSIVSEAQERLTHLTSRANDFVQNQIVPAAHRAIETGQPVAILIGKKSVTLAVAMARELINNPFVQAGLVYGFFQPNHKEYETWTHMLHRFLDAVSQYPIGLQAPRPLTEYEKFIQLIKNMYEWGAYGATYGFKYTWILKTAKMIGNHMLEEEGENPSSTKALLNKGMNSLQELWNVYDYVRNPISSIARTATRAIAGPIVEPLLRRTPQPPSDSDRDPTAASSRQLLPITDPRRRIGIIGKKSEQAAANKGITVTPAAPAAVPMRRLPVKRQDAAYTAKYGKGHGFQGGGQQALKTQAPLVNYGAGVRQMRRGGGKTIQGLAPVLEFNETADDPYVMRQQVR